MEEIQKALMEQINSIRSGEDIRKAKAICKLSAQYIYTYRLAMENKKIQSKVAKFSKDEKDFMEKDFSNIRNIKVGK